MYVQLGLIRKVMNHPVTGDSYKYSSKAFENEDPCPSRLASHTSHLGDAGGEETAKGASKGCGGKEDGSTDAELRPFVPASVEKCSFLIRNGTGWNEWITGIQEIYLRKIVVDAWEQAGFCYPKPPSLLKQSQLDPRIS